MKVKEAAAEVNRKMAGIDLSRVIEDFKSALRSGDEDLAAEIEASCRDQMHEIAHSCHPYFCHLLGRLAEAFQQGRHRKLESLRAVVLEHDRNWRAFVARLNPCISMAVSPDAFKDYVSTGAVGSFAWPSRTAPLPPTLQGFKNLASFRGPDAAR